MEKKSVTESGDGVKETFQKEEQKRQVLENGSRDQKTRDRVQEVQHPNNRDSRKREDWT